MHKTVVRNYSDIFTVRNEVAKVMFLQVSVCLSTGGGGSGGVCSWGGYLVWGGVGIPACTEADTPPPERRLLLRTVRILLKCILVIIWILKCQRVTGEPCDTLSDETQCEQGQICSNNLCEAGRSRSKSLAVQILFL